MTCFIARNLLSELVDGVLESSRAAELQAHLAGCPSCAREVQEIRRVRTLLRALPVHRAPADFLSKVKAKAEQKSLLERAGGVLAPLLRLPRPAQAGLAFAASLVIAVTVFWTGGRKAGVFELDSAPGGPRLGKVSEVANMPAAVPPPPADAGVVVLDGLLDRDGTARGEDDAKRVDQRDEEARADKPQSPPEGEAAAQRMAAPRAPAGALAAAATAPAPTPPLPRPATATAPLANGMSGAGRKDDGSTGAGGAGEATVGRVAGGAVYQGPSVPGLYASSPGDAHPKAEAPARAGASRSPAGAETETGVAQPAEPAFDTAAAFAAPRPDAALTGDDWAAPTGSTVAETKTADTRREKSKESRKELRRERSVAPVAADPVATAAEEAEARDELATASSGAAPSPAAKKMVPTIQARYHTPSATAPAEVVAAAYAAGGTVVAPVTAPPSLGKTGASTVVIVEIPAAGVASFEEALRAAGTLERKELPAGSVRYRLEVVRQ